MRTTYTTRIASATRIFCLTILLFIGQGLSAQTRIQTATGNTGSNEVSSFTVTLPVAPQSGNTLIAVIGSRTGTTNNVSGITQTGTPGATWVKAESVGKSGTNTEIWYTTVLSGTGTEFTITQSSTRSAAIIMEYSGLLYGASFDEETKTATGKSKSASTGTTSTTTVANELWIGGITLKSSGYSLSGIKNSFAEIDNAVSTNASASRNPRVYALENVVTTKGTANTGGAVSSDNYWSGAIATFKQPISSISPISACAGSGASITINGTGFTGATAVKFNGVAATYTVNSNTKITATLPSGASSGLISVTMSGGAVAYSNEAFLVKSPPIPTADITNTTCPSSTDGKVFPNNIPSAINFNPTQNQYIDLNTTLLNELTAFTLEGWVKTTTYNRNSFFGQDNAVEIGFASNGDIELWSEGLQTNITVPYPKDGLWHHVAGVGNGNNMSIFIDGVQVATRTHSALSSPTNYGSSGNTAKIGGYVWSTTPNYFSGQMLKVGFWNRALTGSEIANLAASPAGYTSGNGLIAGYNFYEGAGTTLARTPTGTNGTFKGSPVSTWSDLFAYNWSKVSSAYSATTKNIDNLGIGTYNLAATFNGCTSNSGDFVVASNGTESTPATAMNGTSPVCNGSSAELTLEGGTLGTAATWKWYSGTCGTNPITTGLTDGGRTLTVTPTSTTTYYARAEGTCNTTACVSFTVVVNPTGAWLGITTDWNDAQNWCGSIPTSTTDVTIPAIPFGGNQPTVGSAGAVCKTLTINTGATVTMGGAYAFNLYGNITNNGSFVPATSTVTFKASGSVLGSSTTTFHHLTVDASQTLTASASTMNITGNWTNNGTFANNGGTVAFTGTTVQEIKGTNTFNNLTINNTAGVVGKNDISVNGVLNLASASPNETNGTLEMTNSYGDYSNIQTPENEKTTRRTAQCDILDSYILNMGANATTIGVGDVTGKVRRTTINENTAYSFGNFYNTITFNKNGTGTLPTAITFVITKGSDRGIHANKTDAVKRLYQVIRTGGTLPTSFTLKFHYKNDELNGIQKDTLILWDHHIPYKSTNTPHEHGKTAYNTSDNWVELSGHGIGYLDTQEVVGGTTKYWMFAESLTSGNTWLGAGDSNGEHINDWNYASNWSGGNIPTCADNVIIPVVSNAPTIPSSGANVKSIEIQSGATLNGGTAGELTICGGIKTNGGKSSWSNNGTFNEGTSTVTFDYPRTTLDETTTITGTANFYNVSVNTGTYLVLQTDANTSVSNTLTQNGNLDARTYLNTFSYTGGSAQTVVNPAVGNGYRNLVLSGAGTKTLPVSVLKVSGDLTLNSGFSATSNTIEFDGSILQTLSGSSTSALNHVTMNNAAGLTLSKNQTVNGTLTLSNGLVNTGSNALSLTCNASTSGQSSSSYINGKLAREYCSASSKVYPIGKGGNYRPITLEYTSLSGGSSTVQAEQIESEIQGSISNDITYQTVRYWNLSETAGAGNGNFKITLDGSPFVANATPKILRGNGTTNEAFDASFSTPNFTTSDNFTDNVFGKFAVASECLPPVITTAPQNTVACELNSTPTFTVVPVAGTYTYAWEVNTGSGWNAVSNGGLYSNANTATLTITNPPYSMNAYSYRANVIRDCGGTATSETATLTVNPQPQGSLSGMEDICKGDEGFLTWTATAGTGPYSLVYNAGAENVTVNDVVSGTAFSVGNISVNTTFTLVSVTGENCSRTANFTVGNADITVNPYITWTGAIDRDWNTAGNWCGGIPTASDNVQIPNVTNQPLISNEPTATTKSLIIDNQSSVTISGSFTLDIKGNLTNNGVLTGAEGTLLVVGYIENNGTINTKNTIPQRDTYGGTIVLNGTTPQTLYGGTYQNIVIDNAVGVTMPTDAVVNTLGTFEVKADAKMEIGTGRTVIANTLLNSAGAAGIRIKAAAEEPNGTLIFNNAVDNPAQATVEMHSPASWNLSAGANQKYYWQYFGIPVKRVSQLGTNFYGAFVRRYNEPGKGTASSTPLQNRLWVQLQNNDYVSNKKGYELTQAAPLKYAFAGELYNSDMDTTLSYSSSGQYPGQHVLSNPYTSAIDITKIVFDENMDKTVYIYNTGSYANWEANTDPNKLGSSPGQYIAAPQNTAGSGEIPAEIPSMQGFLVRTNVAGEGSIFISYNAVKKSNTGPQRAPKAPMTWLRLNLQGATADGDVMWLFSSPQTTEGNDNGWDGRKFASASGTPMLYSQNETGAYQIDARPDIHETNIVFRGGALDNEYSLILDNENMGRDYGNIYLFDKETGEILNITESGTKYDFTSSGTGSSYRFQILTSLPEVTNTKKEGEQKIKVFSSHNFLYIDNQSDKDCVVEVYDQPGRLLGRYHSKAALLKSINTGFSPGSYIVRTLGEEVKSKVVIIR